MPRTTINGAELYYAEGGAGDPPIVFVHGWTCDHTYFAPQFEHFGRSHQVVSVDLRGHGQSDKPLEDYAMAALADDVATLAAELKLNHPVVVGHSMGGIVALEAAARHRDAFGAVVLVDSPVLVSDATRDALSEFIAALRQPAYQETQRGFCASALFAPFDDPDVKERVLDAMGSCPQHVMASCFEQLFAWDGAVAAAGAKIPVLFISANATVADLVRFKELCPQLVTGQTVGAGHFNQLLVPEQVNAMIQQFLVTALSPKS
ncbi:MAG: alpha/beta fold hydrolase [Acidimicrobiales bacterium]